MTRGELVHSDFEQIERRRQTYRISTKIRYDGGEYRCKATLYKSYNGSVSGDPLTSSTAKWSEHDQERLEELLESCVEDCREYMEDVETAKFIDVDISYGSEE